MNEFLKLISGFLTSHLHKDPVSIHGAFKGMSYGQAAIAFTIFMHETSGQSGFMAAFSFIFPIFIALGAAFGIMAQQESKDGKVLAVATLIFLILTSLHSIALFVFFFSFNKFAALTFLLSFFLIFYIFGWAAKLYSDISK